MSHSDQNTFSPNAHPSPHRSPGEYGFSGVRPSPGAASNDDTNAAKPSCNGLSLDIAATGDGRTPRNTYPPKERDFTESQFRTLPPRTAANGNSVRSVLFVARDPAGVHLPLLLWRRGLGRGGQPRPSTFDSRPLSPSLFVRKCAPNLL